ncbi:hypothetical protein GPALN_011667 [Globodera pallida]|nr:hypothetical protein GPALN_011667 [Globodera pallida]
MPSNKYERKRKKDLDSDTTHEQRKRRDDEEEAEGHRRHRSRSPKKSSRHKKQRTASPGDEGGDTNVESLSIEETNKLRAKLGLAPLELDDKSEPVEKEDGSGEKVFTEYGIEIVHKAAKSWAEERHGKEVKEKLDTRKKQREVYTKVLKAKRTLGEESDEEAAGTNDMTKWVEKSRKLEEEMRKAEHKAKLLDEMDEAFGIGGLIQAEQQKQKRRTTTTSKAGASSLSGAGFVVGHSIQQFSEGRETVLILQDKEILDEAEDEVLINPNMLENERHKLNVEKRKKKDNYQPYEEEVDEFGQIRKQQMLAKYDESMDGEKERETFRLDESGQYDLDKEAQELETRRRLMMLNKKFETLDSTKYTLATEFHTEEEMIAFRRPKKKGGKSERKRKTLKAADLVLESLDETEEEKRLRETKLAARRAEMAGAGGDASSAEKAKAEFRDTLKEESDIKTEAAAADASAGGDEREDGELVDEERARRRDGGKGRKRRQRDEERQGVAAAAVSGDATAAVAEDATPPGGKEKWKGARANVNVDLLKSLADKMKRDAEQAEDDEEEEEDQFPHVTNGGAAATSLLFIEDEAEEELNAVLAKARRLRQAELQIAAQKKNAAAAGVAVSRSMKTEQYNGVSSDEEETAAATAAMTAQERNAVVFDSTSEKYKSIGGIYGLFSASKDPVKMEPILEEEDDTATKRSSTSEQKKKAASATAKEVRKGSTGSDTEMMVEGVDADVFDSLLRMDTTTKEEQQEEEHGSSDSQSDEDDDNPSSTATYTNILGEEKDVTKGVGAMLKLAGQKGYLESGERKLDEGKLKHLESKRFSKVEQGRYDIEDKTMRKLERMGTTGTGPTRPFPDKAEYTPKFEINYADQKGRILDPKEAFRVLSWKFHGKGPGKKQAEKHAAKVVKREKLKKMNSMDTPLGTLNKQLKKQEQLQAPYLVLSGRGDGGQPLQKE